MFFDTAEACPWTNEELVGEALAPVRDKVVIASQFGWNIDPDTGARGPGLNSRPEQIRLRDRRMLNRLKDRPDRSAHQHRVDPDAAD